MYPEATFLRNLEINGSEAAEIGLVTHVSDSPRDAALELAREIAGKSPNAIRSAKTLLQESRAIDHSAGLELEARLQASLIGRPNQKEAVLSNIEKRAASYEDPA